MDAVLRSLERTWKSEATLPAFVRYLEALVRAGRSADVPPLVIANGPSHLGSMGAEVLADLRGTEPNAESKVRLIAWKLRDEVGGGVLVEARRRSGTSWHVVSPGEVIDVVRVCVEPPYTRLRLTTQADQRDELAELRGATQAEIEDAVRKIASAARATIRSVNELVCY